MADLEKRLQRWVEAQLIDNVTAHRILEFEKSSKGKLRWQAILAIGFGAVMLCAGILLFVAAHWDQISPGQRFGLVLAMVAVFHVAAGVLGKRVPSIGTALHMAGTICLGAGIYLAAQIFHLQEHWPSGVLLWSVGAILAWLVLRQWPQALLAAVLIPWWLAGEWWLATERYEGHAFHIAAQGFLLLSLFYLSATPRDGNRALRLGLIWVGEIGLLPSTVTVMFSSNVDYNRHLPVHLLLLGYAAAYVPVLALAAFVRKKRSVAMFAAALWVLLLTLVSKQSHPDHSLLMISWIGLSACALCYWGVSENRSHFINLGTAIFALDVIWFYFSDVLDKLGRSVGLILLGVVFLAGGWLLNNLRSNLIARAAAGGNQ
ncbi:MAG TPA: DUF2157 domain-containing protein [Candidatus Solibacter sp.]|jgi:uncharacterized membrane protein|nr:DUF2157 domain-containing protein [Candidatus Solibacter sp.]